MSALEKVAMVLAAIGAINWGLVALKSFSAIDYSLDLVALLLGSVPWLAAIVYLLVGISGVWLIVKAFS
jgi:uncharacterized protein